MTKLTKTDIAALRKASTIAVRITKNSPDGIAEAIKEVSFMERERDPFAVEQRYTLETVAVKVDGDYYNRKPIIEGRATCFALVYLYHSQNTSASTIIKSLKVGDEIIFRFQPDWHSNDYVRQAGLHADVLVLEVRRGSKLLRYVLQTSVCPNNTARMCYGLTTGDEARQRARVEEGVAS